MSPVPAQIQPMTARARRLRERLIDLAVEAQADSNRLRSAGGVCMAQADTVNRASWALARAAWSIGGGNPTLATFFPGVGTGKRPDGSPEHDNELEKEGAHGRE